MELGLAGWLSGLVPGQVGGQILRFHGLFGEGPMGSGGSCGGSGWGRRGPVGAQVGSLELGARPGTDPRLDPALPRPVGRGPDGSWWVLVSLDGSW